MDSTEQVSIHQKALTLYHNTALSSTKVEVATGKRNLYGVLCENLNVVPVYIHVYDAATADVTVGTTTPTFSIPVPAGGYVDKLLHIPFKQLGTGFVIAITTSKTGGLGTPDTAPLTQFNYK